MLDQPPAPATKKRDRDKNRQRKHRIIYRVSDEEFQQIIAAAESAGLTAASFSRATALKAPPLRAVRRPTVDRQALSQILGYIGRISSNVNQIAKAANTGFRPEGRELLEVTNELRQLVPDLMRALGKRPE